MKKLMVFGVVLFVGILGAEYKLIYSPNFYQNYVSYDTEIHPDFPALYISKWTNIPPSIDGMIESNEWSDATTIDITVPGEDQVLLHIMNDENYIYLALEAVDSGYDSPEEVGIYFDLNYDGVWDADGSEGNFWFTTTSGPASSPGPGIFRSIIEPCLGETPINADGTFHFSSYQDGRSVIEIQISRNESMFTASNYQDTVGFWVYFYDYDGLHYKGDLNLILKRGLWCAPSEYPKLILQGEATEIEEITQKNTNLSVHPTVVRIGEAVKFELENGEIELNIYDVTGRKVFKSLGFERVEWNPLKKGIYFYILKSKSGTNRGKIDVLK